MNQKKQSQEKIGDLIDEIEEDEKNVKEQGDQVQKAIDEFQDLSNEDDLPPID